MTIQPPYTPKDVVLQDKNFRDLAEIVREEIIKFGEFGPRFAYAAAEAENRRKVRAVSIVLLRSANHEEVPTREEMQGFMHDAMEQVFRESLEPEN